MTTPPNIAALTNAEREALGHLAQIGKPWPMPVRWSVLVGYGLEVRGLAKRTFWLDKTYLTPPGQQVAAYLKEQSHDQG